MICDKNQIKMALLKEKGQFNENTESYADMNEKGFVELIKATNKDWFDVWNRFNPDLDEEAYKRKIQEEKDPGERCLGEFLHFVWTGVNEEEFHLATARETMPAKYIKVVEAWNQDPWFCDKWV